jgi:hypothetical protein
MGKRQGRHPHRERSRIPETSDTGLDAVVVSAARKFLQYEVQTELANSSDPPNELARRKAAKLIGDVHLVAKTLDLVLPMEGETWNDKIMHKAHEISHSPPQAS